MGRPDQSMRADNSAVADDNDIDDDADDDDDGIMIMVDKDNQWSYTY